MVQRVAIISTLIVVAVVVAALGMYAAFGNQGGFTGVPRLLPPDFAQGATGSILNTILWGLMIVVLFVLLGVAVYYLRGLKD